MAKIIEGLRGFKNGGDNVFSKSENISVEEDSLIQNQDIKLANLNNFDKVKGYVKGANEFNDKVYSYSFSRLNQGEANERLYFAKHVNIEHDVDNRGKNEIVHFVHTAPDVLIKSITFRKLVDNDISRYVLSSENLSLPEIRELPQNEAPVYFQSDEQKEQVIELLDNIIYAKNSKKTLYVTYDMSDIDNFHRDFFLALNLLPVAACNDITFVTCFGGGLTTRYDVVGVAIELGNERAQGYEDNGLLYRYPRNPMLTSDTPTDNPLHRLLDEVKDVSNFNEFVKFTIENYQNKGGFKEYLDFADLYACLTCPLEMEAGREYYFVSELNKRLELLKEHIDYIQSLDSESLEKFLTGLDSLDGELKTLADYTQISSSLSKTLTLLIELYNSTSHRRIKEAVMSFIYDFLFNYEKPANDTFLVIRTELIENAIKNKSIADPLFDYILNNDSRYLNTLEHIVSLKGFECQHIYYEIVYYRLFLDRTHNVNIARCIDLLLLLNNIVEINKIKNLIINGERDLELSFAILCELLARLQYNKDSSFDDKVIKELTDLIIAYLKEKSLLITALQIIKVEQYPSVVAVKQFKNDIVEAFIGIDEVKEYKELIIFLDKLEGLKNDSRLYNTVLETFLEHHLNEALADSINGISIASYLHDPAIPSHLQVFKGMLEGNQKPIPQAIVAAIKDLERRVNEHGSAVQEENLLVDFRINFILRAVALLPQSDSRSIAYEYIGKDKCESKIGKGLKLTREEYKDAIQGITSEFLNDKGPEGIINSEMSIKHTDFIKAVFKSQNKKRFNVNTIVTIAESLFNLIFFGALGLLLSIGLSFLIYNNVTNQSYLLSLMIISFVIGGLSAIIGLVNVRNKGRKKIYLISLLETLSLVIVGLGLFTLMVFLLGGK